MFYGHKELVRSRLSRLSVSTRFMAEVDGLRSVAFGSVVLYHLLGITGSDSLASGIQRCLTTPGR
jgi:peptidoglycan/LPS O-acetylase OafA/YrhL